MTTSVITALLASTIRQGVPILFPAVGETVAERAGVMNIGLEGNMVIGAFTTLLAYQYTQSLFLAILAGALAGCLSAVIIAYIGVSRNQPQAVVGFMFNIFAAGLTSFLYRVLYATSRPKVPLLSSLKLPLLSKIPVVGGSIFSMDILAYLAILVSLAAGFVLYKTKLGLQLRSLGENRARRSPTASTSSAIAGASCSSAACWPVWAARISLSPSRAASRRISPLDAASSRWPSACCAAGTRSIR